MAGGKTYRTRAIVLDKTKLKETDLILTLISEDGEQLRAVAKGARKPGSRLAARCELFCLSDLLLARGKSLDVVSQAELLEAPLAQCAQYETLSAASALADVAKHCCYEDVQDPFSFAITLKALQTLSAYAGDQPHTDLLVAAYVFKLLSHLGYRPDFSYCVSCGDESLSYFSAAAGGLLCAGCAKSVSGAEPVDADTIAWFQAILANTFNELMKQPIDAFTASPLLSFAHSWAATHLDTRLRSLEFLLGH